MDEYVETPVKSFECKEFSGASVYLKLENMHQVINSYRLRGLYHMCKHLKEEKHVTEIVLTCSTRKISMKNSKENEKNGEQPKTFNESREIDELEFMLGMCASSKALQLKLIAFIPKYNKIAGSNGYMVEQEESERIKSDYPVDEYTNHNRNDYSKLKELKQQQKYSNIVIVEYGDSEEISNKVAQNYILQSGVGGNVGSNPILLSVDNIEQYEREYISGISKIIKEIKPETVPTVIITSLTKNARENSRMLKGLVKGIHEVYGVNAIGNSGNNSNKLTRKQYQDANEVGGVTPTSSSAGATIPIIAVDCVGDGPVLEPEILTKHPIIPISVTKQMAVQAAIKLLVTDKVLVDEQSASGLALLESAVLDQIFPSFKTKKTENVVFIILNSCYAAGSGVIGNISGSARKTGVQDQRQNYGNTTCDPNRDESQYVLPSFLSINNTAFKNRNTRKSEHSANNEDNDNIIHNGDGAGIATNFRGRSISIINKNIPIIVKSGEKVVMKFIDDFNSTSENSPSNANGFINRSSNIPSNKFSMNMKRNLKVANQDAENLFRSDPGHYYQQHQNSYPY
ncbi:hypothetical protein AX774_g8169 [Zancudomyces culisetae]|uniref:Uncharacterized protein n=1 Tax=Zancudomyces culisetae TaxID=1213189 RepID=A0A1R1PBS6_ZANCU|nr:hypothetical protein AX774_g8169 [Zancudomyces culisetae]|eukprot:OMH78435.1 hypothetical protein AX774_g8169 [Zancudomyces culisetae]